VQSDSTKLPAITSHYKFVAKAGDDKPKRANTQYKETFRNVSAMPDRKPDLLIVYDGSSGVSFALPWHKRMSPHFENGTNID